MVKPAPNPITTALTKERRITNLETSGEGVMEEIFLLRSSCSLNACRSLRKINRMIEAMDDAKNATSIKFWIKVLSSELTQ